MKKLGITLVAAALCLPIFAKAPQSAQTPATQTQPTTKKHTKKHHSKKKSAAKPGTTPEATKK